MFDRLKRASEAFMTTLRTGDSDSHNTKLHWHCKDEIYKNGVLVDTIESSNLVVDKCSVLLAQLMSMKNTNGIQYWAIGSGSAAWDEQWGTPSPPTPSASTVKLVNEIYRKAITSSDIKYVDSEGTEYPDTTPTNMIKITIVVGESEGNGDWREFGLFGGGATATRDSGLMIDHKIHKILSKTSEISVTRSIVLEF